MFTWSASIPVTLTSAFPPGLYTAYIYGYNGSALSSLVSDNEGYSKPDTANFKYPTLTAGFEVVKANQTINFGALTSKTYDAAVFSPFTTTITGFVSPETVAVVSGTAAFSANATTAVNAGNYTITLSSGALSASNYDFTVFNTGTLTISKAPLTITAATNTKTYDGTTSAAATPTVLGLQGGDTVTGRVEAYATKHAATNKTLNVFVIAVIVNGALLITPVVSGTVVTE